MQCFTISRLVFVCMLVGLPITAAADDKQPAPIGDVELQPLAAQVQRVAQALDLLGSPLSTEQQQALDKAVAEGDAKAGVLGIQAVLDPLCLAWRRHQSGKPRQSGRRARRRRSSCSMAGASFWSRSHNEAGVTAALRVASPNAAPIYTPLERQPRTEAIDQRRSDVSERWLDVQSHDAAAAEQEPVGPRARIPRDQLYSRDVGQREAKLMFDVGQGTQDLGFRNELNVLFQCEPAVRSRAGSARRRRPADDRPVRDSRQLGPRLSVAGAGGWPLTFSFTIRSIATAARRCFCRPASTTSPTRAGRNTGTRPRRSKCPMPPRIARVFHLQRWIKLADHGWYSGDHHIHARRLRPLRIARRRRAARRHDAAHPGRRSERRLRAVVGTVLVLSKAVLRGQGQQACPRPTI